MHRTMLPNLFSYLRLSDTLDINFLIRVAMCSDIILSQARELALLLVVVLLDLRWEHRVTPGVHCSCLSYHPSVRPSVHPSLHGRASASPFRSC